MGRTQPNRPAWLKAFWAVPAAAVFAIYLPFVRGWYLADDFTWLFLARAAFVKPATLLHPDPYGYLRPVPHALTALQWGIQGDRSTLFILSGIALHAVNCTLVAVVGWLLMGRRAVGWAAGLCFALITHYWPDVPWLAGRTEMCAALFALLALICLIRWRQTSAPAWYPAALGAFMLALASKEIAGYFWIVLLAVDVSLGRPKRWWLAHVPFGVVFLGFAWLEWTLHAQRLAEWQGDVWERPWLMPRNWLYVVLAAASPLHTRVPHSRLIGHLDLSLAGALVLLLAAWAAPRRLRWLALAWVGLAAVPLSLPRPQYYFSWYGYGPAIGVALLAGGAIAHAVAQAGWRRAAAVGAAALYAALSLWQLAPSRALWLAQGDVLRRVAASAPAYSPRMDLVNLPVGGLFFERKAFLAYVYPDKPIPDIRVVDDRRRPAGLVARP